MPSPPSSLAGLLLGLLLLLAAPASAAMGGAGAGRRRSTTGWVAGPLHGRQGLRSGRRGASLAMAAAGAGGKPGYDCVWVCAGWGCPFG